MPSWVSRHVSRAPDIELATPARANAHFVRHTHEKAHVSCAAEHEDMRTVQGGARSPELSQPDSTLNPAHAGSTPPADLPPAPGLRHPSTCWPPSVAAYRGWKGPRHRPREQTSTSWAFCMGGDIHSNMPHSCFTAARPVLWEVSVFPGFNLLKVRPL